MKPRWTWLYGYTDDPTNVPEGEGIDPAAPIRAVRCGALIAVVSDVAVEDWTGPAAEARLADVEQVAPLAVRHLEIVERVRRVVVPSPFATLFSSDAALMERTAVVARALTEAADRVRGRREWSVKGLVDPAPVEPVPAAASGAGWMRARRDQQRRAEDRQAQITATAEAWAERLQPLAVASVARDGAVAEIGSELAFTWAFLVDEERADAFRDALGGLGGASPVRCAWGGPFPPYSFVGESARGG